MEKHKDVKIGRIILTFRQYRYIWEVFFSDFGCVIMFNYWRISWYLSVNPSRFWYSLHYSTTTSIQILDKFVTNQLAGRYHRPHGPSRGSAAARVQGLRVRIPPGAWISLLRLLCAVRQRSVRWNEHMSRGVLPSVMCLSVILEPQDWRILGPLGLSSYEKQSISLLFDIVCVTDIVVEWPPPLYHHHHHHHQSEYNLHGNLGCSYLGWSTIIGCNRGQKTICFSSNAKKLKILPPVAPQKAVICVTEITIHNWRHRLAFLMKSQ